MFLEYLKYSMIVIDFLLGSLKRLKHTSVLVQARYHLTLFCYIYNVFVMFLIDFCVLNSNTTSASLKSLSIFVDSR